MDRQELYPLSYPQKDIYAIQNYYEINSINNVNGDILYHSEIDSGVLEKAIEQVIEEHSSFHLRFSINGRNENQYLEPGYPPNIIKEDFLGDEEGFNTWIQKMNDQDIDIFRDYLYLFAIYVHPSGKLGYYFRLHHMISDGWSMVLIVNEINENYVNLINDKKVKKENPSYLEFIEREQKYLQSKRFEKDRAFWLEEFANAPREKLLDGMNKKIEGTPHARRLSFEFSRQLIKQIHQFCEKYQVSVLTFFLSCISSYFYKITSKQDFVLGTLILNRATKREKDIVGMFINSMPIRIQLDSESSLHSLSENIQKKLMTLLRHQKYPHHLLKEDIRKNNETTDKLYDVLVSYQNASLENEEYPYYKATWLFSGQAINPLSFHINDRDNSGKMEMDYDFQTDVFTEKEIKDMHKYLIQLMENLLNENEEHIKHVDILNQHQIEKLAKGEHDAQYPLKTLPELFEQQANIHPDAVAVERDTEQITYKDLQKRSNQLARYLHSKGVRPNDLVALYMDRSIEMIVSIIAVIKSGAAYLPIDPSFPKRRIDYILSDSQAKLLITTKDYQAYIQKELAFPGGLMDVRAGESVQMDTTNMTVKNSPDDLAYIIYTSGSTGNPKGVMVTHRNVVQLLINDQHPFTFTDQDVWTMFHSYCFDFSVWEMYGALLYGGKLVIVPKEVAVDSNAFMHLLIDKNVTVLNQTPSAFYNFIHEDQATSVQPYSLRYIIFGGEALKPIKFKKWKQKYPDIQLVNMYGITETTIHVTHKELTLADMEDNVSNAGKPIPTLNVYILDDHLNMQPEGIIGEICVAGDGVTKGYLDKKELTEKVFVDNPFLPGTKMYCSDDLGRILPNGEIEYIGRKDFQVKIRGYRVELGEIEREILQLESIDECVVLDYLDNSDNNSLCVFLLMEEDIGSFEIRTYLAEKLPEYMIPTKYIPVDVIPLTANGKVDRKELENLLKEKENNTLKTVVAPRNSIEEKLLAIWKQELQLDSISVDDNFFNIGGHSLNASYLVVQINHCFSIKLSIGDIFKFPSIELLATYIQSVEYTAAEDKVIQPLEKRTRYPVSSAEKRMFTLWEMDKSSLAYMVLCQEFGQVKCRNFLA
ncbi:non-ribosomal peptide synthetase [Lentibacillus salicampi]|uniref:Non-ribosomal peptide synthetase n=1 Tax=Lentibacillus salicampi TaxID=175306 RepID=A0A4Y9A824_9BACI|nr:non-ribosomal peptide synthetase [Lentibacillus salicampi]TFJ91958.1 non-ribosomal peptide synthetase [Lentibacillus salicampi]